MGYRSTGGHLSLMSLNNSVLTPGIYGKVSRGPTVEMSITNRLRCKMRYKNAIKEAASSTDSMINDRLYDNLSKKDNSKTVVSHPFFRVKFSIEKIFPPKNWPWLSCAIGR